MSPMLEGPFSSSLFLDLCIRLAITLCLVGIWVYVEKKMVIRTEQAWDRKSKFKWLFWILLSTSILGISIYTIGSVWKFN